MNSEERKALREKHASYNHIEGDTCLKDWSCDVLQVLDVLDQIAMETTKYLQDVKIVPENIIDNIIKILDGVNES